jgi:hypothetical protein
MLHRLRASNKQGVNALRAASAALFLSLEKFTALSGLRQAAAQAKAAQRDIFIAYSDTSA